MTGPLAQQIAQVREVLILNGYPDPDDNEFTCPIAALSVIEQWATDVALHVQDTRENIALALPDHGGRCGGTDEKPAALDQSDRFANPCIRCRVLLAFDAALPASGTRNPRNRVAREKEEDWISREMRGRKRLEGGAER